MKIKQVYVTFVLFKIRNTTNNKKEFIDNL